jgi:hypothetical protein
MLCDALRLEKGTFVPMKSEPGERIENAASHLVAGTFKVGVFYAEDKDTVLLARK